MRSLFLFVLLFVSYSNSYSADFSWNFIHTQIESEKLYNQRGWQKILHFEPNMFGQIAGQVDSDNFYLSPKRTLHSELTALATEMEKTLATSEESSVWCRFPARVTWLKKQFPSQIWPQKTCARFQKFAEALQGQSLSVVFSSYYLNNPSSAFGHTFLRINKFPSAEGNRYELLDYGINYAANQDSNNPVVYTVKGLFGGFNGVFSSVPYYYKVREYASAERRDLWEYELNINKDQVKYFVEHIWELGPTYIDYWYLTENCSYHMLSLLEAINPDLDLLGDLKKWVIPSDTLKIVWNEPGLVKSFYYRPSVRSEFQERFKNLSSDQKKVFKTVVKDHNLDGPIQKENENSKAQILDASMDWIDSEYAVQVQKPETPEAKFKGEILKLRSQTDVISAPLKVSYKDTDLPHLSHGSRKWDLGVSATKNSGNYAVFNYKFALHDFLDSQIGYPEYATITFGDLGFSYSNKFEKVEIEKATLVEVISISPWTEDIKPLSWRLGFGLERFRDQNCDFCHGSHLNFGAGISQRWGDTTPVTAMIGARAWAVQYFAADPRYSSQIQFGPYALVRFQWSTFTQTYLEGYWKDNYKTENRFQREVTLAHQWNTTDQKWGAKILLKDLGFDQSAGVSWVGFY